MKPWLGAAVRVRAPLQQQWRPPGGAAKRRLFWKGAWSGELHKQQKLQGYLVVPWLQGGAQHCRTAHPSGSGAGEEVCPA